MKLYYQLQYNDDTIFTGNSLNGDWNKAPNKPIKRMLYFFDNKKFLLEKFKSYNHLVEKVSILGKKEKITQVLLIGRKEEESKVIVIDFKRKKIFQEVVAIGKEYNNLILSGWKEGI